jgi:anionic cell wall polymer biosynthesis LytR-Cps2A-Psr (LCP) family protein
VEQFIGVPIQYYAQIDFYTFVEFIDLIGGIEIHNDEEMSAGPARRRARTRSGLPAAACVN